MHLCVCVCIFTHLTYFCITSVYISLFHAVPLLHKQELGMHICQNFPSVICPDSCPELNKAPRNADFFLALADAPPECILGQPLCTASSNDLKA